MLVGRRDTYRAGSGGDRGEAAQAGTTSFSREWAPTIAAVDWQNRARIA